MVIWKAPSKSIENPYEDGDTVKANANELLVLNCSALASLPSAYIGWTATDPDGRTRLLTSDCTAVITDSDPRITDPVLKTVDTTKCIRMMPTYDEHRVEITCTAVHEAHTEGLDAVVTLDLCGKCIQLNVYIELGVVNSIF